LEPNKAVDATHDLPVTIIQNVEETLHMGNLPNQYGAT